MHSDFSWLSFHLTGYEWLLLIFAGLLVIQGMLTGRDPYWLGYVLPGICLLMALTVPWLVLALQIVLYDSVVLSALIVFMGGSLAALLLLLAHVQFRSEHGSMVIIMLLIILLLFIYLR